MNTVSKPIRLILLFTFALYFGLHNGYLALWQYGSDRPHQIFPYHVSLYTDVDRTLLENGICISSEEDLSKLLEDYLS